MSKVRETSRWKAKSRVVAGRVCSTCQTRSCFTYCPMWMFAICCQCREYVLPTLCPLDLSFRSRTYKTSSLSSSPSHVTTSSILNLDMYPANNQRYAAVYELFPSLPFSIANAYVAFATLCRPCFSLQLGHPMMSLSAAPSCSLGQLGPPADSLITSPQPVLPADWPCGLRPRNSLLVPSCQRSACLHGGSEAGSYRRGMGRQLPRVLWRRRGLWRGSG